MLLGNAPLTRPKLVSAITEGFPFYAPPVDQTRFLRRALQTLGTSLNYQVIHGPSGREVSDSSLEMAWWEPGRGTVLAVECEWGVVASIAAAFARLMGRKAPMKLLVFGSRRAGADREDILLRTDIDAVLAAVGAALLDFSQHVEGELYVLLERVEREPRFRSYEFEVPGNGRLELPFQQAAQVFRVREACVGASGSHQAVT